MQQSAKIIYISLSSVKDYRTVLNDEEIKIFMGLLLHPNRLSIGKAIANEAKTKGYNLVISKQGKVLYSSDDLTANIQKAVK